jgi:hypothetical protein
VKFESAHAWSFGVSAEESAPTGRPKDTPAAPNAAADELDPTVAGADPAGRHPSSAMAVAAFNVNARPITLNQRIIMVRFLLSIDICRPSILVVMGAGVFA